MKAIEKLRTQDTFSRAEAERLRKDSGIIDPLPEACSSDSDGERWSRQALIDWCKRSPRGRPLVGLVTR